MVRMVGTGRGDVLVLLVSQVYLGLPVQLVLMVTVTRQHATCRQGRPISRWMWKDLQGTESHSGRDREIVGLAPLSTQHFSSSFCLPWSWRGPLASSLVCEHVLCQSHRHQKKPSSSSRKETKRFYVLQKSSLVCFSTWEMFFFLWKIWHDQKCLFIPLSSYLFPPFLLFSEIKGLTLHFNIRKVTNLHEMSSSYTDLSLCCKSVKKKIMNWIIFPTK